MFDIKEGRFYIRKEHINSNVKGAYVYRIEYDKRHNPRVRYKRILHNERIIDNCSIDPLNFKRFYYVNSLQPQIEKNYHV